MPLGWTPLSYTAMRKPVGGGLVATRCHAGHQFYKDALGDWQDVDYALADMGTYWELTKASYRLRIAKDFGAAALIQYTNRYEGANHQITYEPHSIWWMNADNRNQRTKFRDAQPVAGTYDSVTQTITWPNAFGPGVDFEVVVQRSGFKKNIVAHAAPPAGPYANNWLVPMFKWDAQGLTLKDASGGDWDNNGYFEAGEFEIRENVNPAAISHIKQALAIDARGRTRVLRVMFEKRAGALWQGKIIPESLLQAATYPVRADTVTSFFTGAGDGYARSEDASWDTAHDATTGDGANYTGTSGLRAWSEYESGTFGITRGFAPLDTSSLPDGDTISSATFYATCQWYTDDDGATYGWVTLVESSQASASQVVTADFDQCGAINNPTELVDSGDRLDLALSVGVEYTFALNAAGLAAIDKTGTTLLGLRQGHDATDNAIASGGDNWSGVSFYTSERTGTAEDPYLEVTHAAPVRRIFITHS